MAADVKLSPGRPEPVQLTARFTELVGEPAMHYVARWRMHVALTWRKEENAPVSEMASRLGYESEAAFSRAFKRFLGFSPGTVRRAKSDRPPQAASLTAKIARHQSAI